MKYTCSEDEYLYTLVENGISSIRVKDTDPSSMRMVYMRYEEILFEFDMEAVPLDFDGRTGTLQFAASFLKQADEGEFNKWRIQFLKSYEASLLDDPDEEIEIANPYSDTPDLPYREDNYGYARYMVCTMLGLPPEKGDEIDDYGWLENRRKKFYETLAFVCDQYCLPRLPVKFDPKSAVPYVLASNSEVALFASLALSRYDEMHQLEKKTIKDHKKLYGEMRSNELPPGVKKLGDKRDDVRINCQAAWQEDNANYDFPSAIDIYPVELLEKFEEGFSSAGDFINKDQIISAPAHLRLN